MASTAGAPIEVQRVTIHGHARAFVKVGPTERKGGHRGGTAPVILLLHGLGCDHTTWLPVIRHLARTHTVIAPDMLGHGLSAKPRADYSIGAFANGMRDLCTVLGVDKVTVVGHSLGGGVAMQFAYQFPERTERLILVAPGGLGPEVTPLIRALTIPGAHQALGLVTLPGVRHAGKAVLHGLSRTGNPATRDLAEIADIYESFKDPHARAAIRHVVRTVIDLRGQIVSMVDRAYLTQAMPMLIVWGTEDMVLPVRHAENVAAIAPGAVVEIFPNSGHFPHKDHPERFVKVVREFIRHTEPATYHRGRWRTLLRNGPTAPLAGAAAGDGPVAAVRPLRRAQQR
ncbi:alpha/beta fold hydrolase [Nocardioides terrisoli]|uniref:alpha/beta fold hydrolase n=1 Tax=Nocardioides terrisoli TaxID=3388267 RepID=UPI00287B8609|nr:alpha/beta fold hydrolase [Nocardioides marmorisolisilvae]